MTLDLSRALLVVREYDPDTLGPLVPETWQCNRQGRTDWYELVDPSGVRAMAYRENERAGLGLYAVFGSPAILTTIQQAADLAMPAREAWRRKDEPTVATYLRGWRTLRCSGFERDPEGNPVAFDNVRSVVPRGALLPDYTTEALPWNLGADGALTTQANAVIRVDAVSGPDTLALTITLAGHPLPARFADEEDPGAA